MWATSLIRSRVLVIAGGAMMILSVLPLAYLSWFTHFHNFSPLLMPVSLGEGTYKSPFFTTDLDEMEIGLSGVGLSRPCTARMDWLECLGPGKLIELDWKIVDDHGRVVREEHFKDTVYAGYNVLLGYYSSKHLSRQRMILAIQKGIPEYDVAHPVLEVNAHPKYSEFMPERWAVAIVIVVVGNFFALLLWGFALFVKRRTDRTMSPISPT